ncbi:MAG: cell division/cell wall cluster transcriptional repressor MraZ [Neisseriaceae bacterium]|nr:cell division/cell wall cluster transcriptional repressor MraZ [Neisseriaceae bacterium]
MENFSPKPRKNRRNMMFDEQHELVGVQDATIDGKGRLAIPAKFRDALSSFDSPVLYTTLKTRSHLLLYPEPSWRSFIDNELPKMQGSALLRSVGALMQNNVEKLTPDASWRILIPPRLRELLNFNDKDVVVAGSSTRLEVWSKVEWDKKTAAVLDIPDEDLEMVLAESGVRI